MIKYKSIYLTILSIVITGWFLQNTKKISLLLAESDISRLTIIISLYLFSHLLRMLRLIILTLDERDRSLPLLNAHALSAFISNLLPFKTGEVLRLGMFFQVFACQRKALAVWLVERFADLIAIASVIFVLYLFNFNLSSTSRVLLFVFVLVVLFGVASMMSIAKIVRFISRHLVMNSLSTRGLITLKICYQLRRLETDLYRCVSGRVSGCLLLSVLLWVIEFVSLALSVNQPMMAKSNLIESFTVGLFASLPGTVVENSSQLSLYQPLALVVPTLVFTVFWLFAPIIRKYFFISGQKPKNI